MNRITISCYILTYNSGKTLNATLQSASNLFDEVVVIDSGSTDQTVNIASQFTSNIKTREFDNFRNQRVFAEQSCANEWVFALDSDEVISPELRTDLTKFMQGGYPLHSNVAAASVCREWYAFGKKVKNFYPVKTPESLIRLFNRSKVGYANSNIIHEQIELGAYSAFRIESSLIHYSCDNLDDLYDKINQYTSLLAAQMHANGIGSSWYRVNIFPWIVWVQWYIFYGSWKDGAAGRILSRYARDTIYLKYAKLYEIQTRIDVTRKS